MDLLQMCKALKTLPSGGGLLDQDSLFVYMARVYEAAVAEKQEREANRSKRQASTRPSSAPMPVRRPRRR